MDTGHGSSWINGYGLLKFALFSQIFAIGTRSIYLSHVWPLEFPAIPANDTQSMNRQHDDGNWHCATTVVRR